MHNCQQTRRKISFFFQLVPMRPTGKLPEAQDSLAEEIQGDIFDAKKPSRVICEHCKSFYNGEELRFWGRDEVAAERRAGKARGAA